MSKKGMTTKLKEEGVDYSNFELFEIDANAREFRVMMDGVLETTCVDARTVISCFLDRLQKQDVVILEAARNVIELLRTRKKK